MSRNIKTSVQRHGKGKKFLVFNSQTQEGMCHIRLLSRDNWIITLHQSRKEIRPNGKMDSQVITIGLYPISQRMLNC